MSIRTRLTKLVYLALSLFYGYLTILVSLFDIFRYGRAFFQVKRRDEPPRIMLDKELGEHGRIKLRSGLKVHYVDAGSNNKPMVLFLHGFPECWYSWRHQLIEFKSDYYCVAMDLRGYGESDKPIGVENYTTDKLVEDIRQFMEALGKQSAVVVCHDWGGALGYMFTAKYPELVDKLIVLNAPHHKHFQEVITTSWRQFFMSWYMFLFQLPILPELLLLANDLQVFDKAFVNCDGEPFLTKEELEVYKYLFSKSGAVTAPLNFYRARSIKTKTEFPAQIKVPTLVIWGKRDAALTSILATGQAKYIDNFSFRFIEDGTHFIQMDKPEIVNKHIRDFLGN